jgi:hypothetical protein
MSIAPVLFRTVLFRIRITSFDIQYSLFGIRYSMPFSPEHRNQGNDLSMNAASLHLENKNLQLRTLGY